MQLVPVENKNVFRRFFVLCLVTIVFVFNAKILVGWLQSNESVISQYQLSHCMVIPICKHQATQVWQGHPKQYAYLSAFFDIKHSRVKWYVYGLMDIDSFLLSKEKLAAYGVDLMGGGCIVGGFQFEHDMAYNKAVWNNIPARAQQMIKGN